MDRDESDWRTVINFGVLGRVTARQDDREAQLQPQQQLMLAALVDANGALVSSSELQYALGWDEMDQPPSRGIKQVASELRIKLALPNRAPLPGGDGAYRLPLESRQADVLRFRTAVTAAQNMSGPDRVGLMRKALSEWGPGAVGLYGGQPLSGLPGAWAESTRSRLRAEHRDAVLECIEQDMSGGRYEMVMRECLDLATDSAALGEDKFVELWMLATYWSGHRTRAAQIFRQAADFVSRSLSLEPSGRLRRLADLVRDEDPRLGGPDSLPDLAFVAVPEVLNVPAVTPAPVRSLPRLVSTERKAMGESDITINISGAASVGSAIGRNDGDVTIHMAAVGDPSGGLSDDGEPDSADPEERR